MCVKVSNYASTEETCRPLHPWRRGNALDFDWNSGRLPVFLVRNFILPSWWKFQVIIKHWKYLKKPQIKLLVTSKDSLFCTMKLYGATQMNHKCIKYPLIREYFGLLQYIKYFVIPPNLIFHQNNLLTYFQRTSC